MAQSGEQNNRRAAVKPQLKLKRLHGLHGGEDFLAACEHAGSEFGMAEISFIPT